MKYLDFYGKRKITEASSDFKYFNVESNKSKIKVYWEYKLIPVMIDIEFGFRINFKNDKIKEDFSDNSNIDYDLFYKDVLNKNLSEKSIKKIAETIKIDNFNCMFVTYGGETELDKLDPTRTNKQYFSHTVTIEAKDNTKYDKNKILDICKNFAKKLESLAYKDCHYYTITKN